MKKVSIILMAVAMVAFTACGNKKKQAQQAAGAEPSFEQVQLEAHIQMQMDSIASMFAKKMPIKSGGLLMDGSITLSDKEKQIKPTYLVDLKQATQVATLTQRYRAFAMISLDKFVAGLYDMNTAEYDDADKKIVTDINDPAFKVFTDLKDKKVTSAEISSIYQDFYNAEVQNGRINLFWELSGALVIENLYIISQNIDKFMPLFTDQDASDFTLRIFLINQSVSQLVAFYPELESLSNALEPLNVLNAMDVAEFKSQLLEMKGQLEIVRNGLLK